MKFFNTSKINNFLDIRSVVVQHKFLRFVIALFANLGDPDKILQLGINDWHSTFCKS